jgi:hypothetical protein
VAAAEPSPKLRPAAEPRPKPRSRLFPLPDPADTDRRSALLLLLGLQQPRR